MLVYTLTLVWDQDLDTAAQFVGQSVQDIASEVTAYITDSGMADDQDIPAAPTDLPIDALAAWAAKHMDCEALGNSFSLSVSATVASTTPVQGD